MDSLEENSRMDPPASTRGMFPPFRMKSRALGKPAKARHALLYKTRRDGNGLSKAR
jgi:hypothetical protein